jgi:hypothetical protein
MIQRRNPAADKNFLTNEGERRRLQRRPRRSREGRRRKKNCESKKPRLRNAFRLVVLARF